MGVGWAGAAHVGAVGGTGSADGPAGVVIAVVGGSVEGGGGGGAGWYAANAGETRGPSVAGGPNDSGSGRSQTGGGGGVEVGSEAGSVLGGGAALASGGAVPSEGGALACDGGTLAGGGGGDCSVLANGPNGEELAAASSRGWSGGEVTGLSVRGRGYERAVTGRRVLHSAASSTRARGKLDQSTR